MENEISLVNPENEPELRDIQRKKFDAAIKSLITGKTPKRVIYQKPGGRGSDIDYVPGWWFVDQLNALFGYDWDWEILDQQMVNDNIWVKGKLTVRTAKGIITKEAFGGGKMKSRTNAAIDLGDDFKSASTDALKKAATLLGLASDIYGEREVKDSGASQVQSQLVSLYKIGVKKGLDRNAVDEKIRADLKKEPDDLSQVEVLGYMNTLRQLPDVASP